MDEKVLKSLRQIDEIMGVLKDLPPKAASSVTGWRATLRSLRTRVQVAGKVTDRIQADINRIDRAVARWI